MQTLQRPRVNDLTLSSRTRTFRSTLRVTMLPKRPTNNTCLRTLRGISMVRISIVTRLLVKRDEDWCRLTRTIQLTRAKHSTRRRIERGREINPKTSSKGRRNRSPIARRTVLALSPQTLKYSHQMKLDSARLPGYSRRQICRSIDPSSCSTSSPIKETISTN